MFVSVVLDPGGMETAKSLATVMARFNFKKIQLTVLKREIDQITDYYDTLRIYQFPVNGNFAITELRHKKWRKCVLGANQK